MTIHNFLLKIYSNKKLQLVEPSAIIAGSYLQKSDSSLISAKILLENKKLEDAVALAYYSMYHMLTALLFRTGIKCENHTASILILSKVFNINNSEIAYAKKERIDKQYYVNFKINDKEAVEAIKSAEKFNRELADFLSRLTNQAIQEHRKKISDLVS
jgi:uncharacterized protein (UPF0332 family)